MHVKPDWQALDLPTPERFLKPSGIQRPPAPPLRGNLPIFRSMDLNEYVELAATAEVFKGLHCCHWRLSVRQIVAEFPSPCGAQLVHREPLHNESSSKHNRWRWRQHLLCRPLLGHKIPGSLVRVQARLNHMHALTIISPASSLRGEATDLSLKLLSANRKTINKVFGHVISRVLVLCSLGGQLTWRQWEVHKLRLWQLCDLWPGTQLADQWRAQAAARLAPLLVSERRTCPKLH